MYLLRQARVLLLSTLTLAPLSGCSGKEKDTPPTGPKENDTIKSVELRQTEVLGLIFVVTTEGVTGPRPVKVLRCVKPKDGLLKVTVKLWDDKEYTASSSQPLPSVRVGDKTTVQVVVARPKVEVGVRDNRQQDAGEDGRIDGHS